MTYRFDKVSLPATKRYIDANGKRRQRTRTFYQTLNPFNVNADGVPKSRDEIMDELRAERKAWLAAPEPDCAVLHVAGGAP